MDDDSIKSLIDNEKEWRKHLIVEMREIKSDQKEMTKSFHQLKMKVTVRLTMFGTFCGSLGAAIAQYIKVKTGG